MKIAVCVPVHRSVPVRFLECFTALVAHSISKGYAVELFLEEQGSLEMKRNRLALRARASGAGYLLWIDDDQTFPPDALERLLKHDVAAVGCNIVTRADDPVPTALGEKGRIYTTAAKAEAGAIEEVRAMGLGLCLVRMNVFDQLDAWARNKGARMCWPLFDSYTDHTGQVTTGEDVYFFGLLNGAGIPSFVDHALSWEVGHIAQTIRTNAQARGESDANSVLPAAGHQ